MFKYQLNYLRNVINGNGKNHIFNLFELFYEFIANY